MKIDTDTNVGELAKQLGNPFYLRIGKHRFLKIISCKWMFSVNIPFLEITIYELS